MRCSVVTVFLSRRCSGNGVVRNNWKHGNTYRYGGCCNKERMYAVAGFCDMSRLRDVYLLTFLLKKSAVFFKEIIIRVLFSLSISMPKSWFTGNIKCNYKLQNVRTSKV